MIDPTHYDSNLEPEEVARFLKEQEEDLAIIKRARASYGRPGLEIDDGARIRHADIGETEHRVQAWVTVPAPTQNRLVVIGWLGIKRAYLNMTREEAMARCRQEMDLDEPVDPSFVKEFEFTDTFNVYDAWGD